MKRNQIQRPLFSEDENGGLFFFEDKAREEGFKIIAGIDEAGRGPLAGPVVAAAVIVAPDVDIPGVTDSKKLTPKKRDLLFDEINKKALSVGIGISDRDEIDRINILQATLLAMQRAIERLAQNPDYLLIDGITPIPIDIPQSTIKKGDSRSFSIAAASIIAKVTRDRMMLEYDKKYPLYNFASHKGYGSKVHMETIASHGPSPIHRKSFSGVKEHIK